MQISVVGKKWVYQIAFYHRIVKISSTLMLFPILSVLCLRKPKINQKHQFLSVFTPLKEISRLISLVD
jgi:hypothetical protein